MQCILFCVVFFAKHTVFEIFRVVECNNSYSALVLVFYCVECVWISIDVSFVLMLSHVFLLQTVLTPQHNVIVLAFKLCFKGTLKMRKVTFYICPHIDHFPCFSFLCVDPSFHLVSFSFSLKNFLSHFL